MGRGGGRRAGMPGGARRAVRSAGHAVEWVTGRPLASYEGPVAFEAKVAMARVARRIERWRPHGNAAYPGHALLRADPRALARLAGRLEHGSVAISGSGRATTTAMLTSIARHAGLRPVTNPTGATLPGGLTAELLAASRPARGTAGDVGVFEIDERWLPRVVEDLGVRVAVLGNVDRDEVERRGDLDAVVATWYRMVAAGPPGLRAVVDVDDLRLAPLAEVRPGAVRFGLDDPSLAGGPLLGTAGPPPRVACGEDLADDPASLAHRPEPDVSAEEVVLAGTGAARFVLRIRETRLPVRLGVGGLPNVCSAVAAAAAAVALDLPLEAVVAGLEATAPYGTAGGNRPLSRGRPGGCCPRRPRCRW